MGCGQSHLNIINPRKCKKRGQKTQDDSGDDNSEEENEEDKVARRGRLVSNKTVENLSITADQELLLVSAKDALPPSENTTVSLHAQKQLSSSQEEFFKMLDEKIERGADYDEKTDRDDHDQIRIRHLLKQWEKAKQRHLNRSTPSAAGSLIQQQQQPPRRRLLFAMPHLINGDLHNNSKPPFNHQQKNSPYITTTALRFYHHSSNERPVSYGTNYFMPSNTINRSSSTNNPCEPSLTAGSQLSNSVIQYDQQSRTFSTELVE